MTSTRLKTDALVIGAGIAGCSSALTLADKGLEVTLIASGEPNTALAQGGIVYKGLQDSPQALERDMLTAGWHVNNLKALKYLCKVGSKTVEDVLINQLNVPFERGKNGFKLTREGGHNTERILYCADYTGKVIMDHMLEAVQKHPNIRFLRRRTAVDLLSIHHHSSLLEYKYLLNNRCVGAYVLNEETNFVETILADATVLATGGIGQVYLHTTNTNSSIGSGLSMVFRAGAKIMNVEYIQFHPTALFHRAPRKFLISEAVRGEGAWLLNGVGDRFMLKYDKRAELAPRDIVTRAILEEMLTTGADCVYLDAAESLKSDVAKRFPTIFHKCLEIGIDPHKDPIPVVPAAHYFCGGILVDIHGRTTLHGLYAAGECTCTGVHGANRLASTSLLECLIWGCAVGRDIAAQAGRHRHVPQKMQQAIPDWVSPGENCNEDPALIAQDWATIRNTMWNYVGIARTSSRLRRAFEDLRALNTRLHDFYRETPISKPLVDLFQGCQTADIITSAALRNTKSFGCHYRVD